jgi:hypothetical protein
VVGNRADQRVTSSSSVLTDSHTKKKPPQKKADYRRPPPSSRHRAIFAPHLFCIDSKMALSMTSATVHPCKLGASVRGLNARKSAAKAPVRASVAVRASAAAEVPDMGKRNVMNLLLVGAIGLPATSLVGGYAYFFVPPRCDAASPRGSLHSATRANARLPGLRVSPSTFFMGR